MDHTYIWDKYCSIFKPDSSMILISDYCIDIGKVFAKTKQIFVVGLSQLKSAK